MDTLIMPALQAAFIPAANSNTRLDAALMILSALLVRQGAKMEGGILQLPLNPVHLKYGSTLFDAVAANPALKEKIRIDDRAYDDVVWDISARGRELARLLYSENLNTQPVRIVITPPMLGPDTMQPHNIVCRTLSYEGKKGVVSLRSVIEPESKWPDALKKFGDVRIIQTNRLSLQCKDGNFYHLKIPALAGQHHGWFSKVEARSHEQHAI